MGNIINKMKGVLEAEDIWKRYLPSELPRPSELSGYTNYFEQHGQTTKPCLFHDENDLKAKCICGKPRVCPDCNSQLAYTPTPKSPEGEGG
jgi:hypothetical protein